MRFCKLQSHNPASGTLVDEQYIKKHLFSLWLPFSMPKFHIRLGAAKFSMQFFGPNRYLDPSFNVLLTRETFCSGGYVTEVARSWKTCPAR